MKTKINITNYLTRGFILAIIAVSLIINISAQKSLDFLSSERYSSASIFTTELNADNNKKLASSASSANTNSDASLEAFLMKAAGINTYLTVEEIETSEANVNNENSKLEQFLISAAGLNQVEICNINENTSDSENESQDAGMIDFLVKAAGLNMYNSFTMN